MNSVSFNIDAIDINVVSEIQQSLDLYDITSLVFLLYDVPYTALERLTLLQRVSDIKGKNLDSICDWARQALTRSEWKYELLEALCVCQLYNVIKKLGFNVGEVKKHFLPDNVHVTIYINPMKKLLYKICENMQTESFLKLKETLSTYDIEVREYEACELVFLKLMVEKFITVGTWDAKRNIQEPCNIKRLANIFKSFQGFTRFALELHETAYYHNETSTRNIAKPMEEPKKSNLNEPSYADFRQIDELIQNMTLDDHFAEPSSKLKTDASKLYSESYEIIDPKKLGICYIINQEKFYPSKESIERNIETLNNRKGTEQDKIRLEETMMSHNFEVITDKNLSHQQIIQNIKNIIKDRVLEQDSVFVLCILSHGMEGSIYGADSVPVPVKDIQNIFDSDIATKLYKKPKVFIIQACQGSQEERTVLVADGHPKQQNLPYRPKSDFLVYWATVPDFLAYRDEKKGSIFIQMLCLIIQKLAKEEHLYDIFTKVNERVTSVCENYSCNQVPVFQSTLRKKLYFELPSRRQIV